MSVEDKIISGTDIGAIFSKPESVDIFVKDKKHGKLKFHVRPMTNEVYARMGNVMKMEGVNLKTPSELENLKIFGQVYYPAMKEVLPYCCLDPKVISGDSTDKSEISVSNIPIAIGIELLMKLLEISGLSDDAEVERKKV